LSSHVLITIGGDSNPLCAATATMFPRRGGHLNNGGRLH
jgi:hypothetical protein